MDILFQTDYNLSTNAIITWSLRPKRIIFGYETTSSV